MTVCFRASRGAIPFFCYILECRDRSLYVGVADDPQRRLLEHNSGKGADWTSERRPVKLVRSEEHPTLSSARKRENQLKRWNHAKKAALVGGSPSTPLGTNSAPKRLSLRLPPPPRLRGEDPYLWRVLPRRRLKGPLWACPKTPVWVPLQAPDSAKPRKLE